MANVPRTRILVDRVEVRPKQLDEGSHEFVDRDTPPTADIEDLPPVRGEDVDSDDIVDVNEIECPFPLAINVWRLSPDHPRNEGWDGSSVLTRRVLAGPGAVEVPEGDRPDVGECVELDGELLDLGTTSDATVYFKYWEQGNKSATVQYGGGPETLTAPGAFSTDVDGLQSGTTYVYVARSLGSDGSFTAASERTFTTP